MKYIIDLLTGTSPSAMTLYRMSASEMSELKKQLENLLEKIYLTECFIQYFNSTNYL